MDKTTVTVERSTLERLAGAKPFDSMSHDEFINHLLDEQHE